MTNLTNLDFDKVISDKWESVRDSLPLSPQIYEMFALGMRFGADWVSREYWTSIQQAIWYPTIETRQRNKKNNT